MPNEEEGSRQAPSWKELPYRIGDDPELVFPEAEGDQGAQSNTYYVAGRLVGRETGRKWAFLTIFAFNDVAHRLRADFYTLSLFDLESGDYGTYTEFDWPRLRPRKDLRLSVATGRLGVSFRSAYGSCHWEALRTEDDELVPFEYQLSVTGKDRAARLMRIDLDVEARKPPMPVGGEEAGGVKTCMGQFGTHSYFQSDVRFTGTLHWGDVEEPVDGDCGWIDRQWTPRYLGVHTDRRNSVYRHEWRQIHLDNGVELCAWLHFDRRKHNRRIPFSGVTASLPDLRVASTTDFDVEPLSFVRDPRIVRPRFPLTETPKYLVDRYRLLVPEWELDLRSEPLVPAPAHELPIEYWSGPTKIEGTMAGKPVSGFGFHERTRVWSRDFELVDVLRRSLRELPDDPFRTTGFAPVAIANRVWEIDAFLSHGAREDAIRYLDREIRPHLEALSEPQRTFHMRLLQDLRSSLFRWWVRG